eukprot:c5863_g1_i2.p1 GENE.c5863_g1_i2~~c5863_g1_i2.p1  ORF type:complete len:114 (+),score=42.17 c5863_g1_i2:22-342(+)
MQNFCPLCCNLLLVDNVSNLRFVCQTCPYTYLITKKIRHTTILERKQVDDVLGGADAWKNADKTTVSCPKCPNKEAYFQQIQIRSADEPMTTFYTCTSCGHQWREG